jgi:hypothetical protein
MAEDGSIYACFEDTVCKVGFSGTEAINALCEGRELACFECDESNNMPATVEFVDPVLTHLLAAGWSKGRSIEILKTESFLNGHGYGLSNDARQFLQEFKGLNIKTVSGGEVNINLEIATTTLQYEEVQEICDHIGADFITPVAVVTPGAITVVVDDHGRMFGTLPGLSDWLVQFGDTCTSGLVAIVSGVGAVKVN